MKADPILEAFPMQAISVLLLALHPPDFHPHGQAGIHTRQESSPRSIFTTLQHHQPLKHGKLG